MCIRDSLIATARSNTVAVCLGFQDFSQLVRDYGDKEAKVVMNTVGNLSLIHIYRAFSAKVCHTRREDDAAPKPIHIHWSIPTM